MSQTQFQGLGLSHSKAEFDKLTSPIKTSRYCVIVTTFVAIIMLVILSNVIGSTSPQQPLRARLLQFDDNYLLKKAEYAVIRKSFLQDKSQYESLQLIESNIAYDEPISDQLQNLEEDEYKRLDSIYHFQNFKKELPFCLIVQGFNFTTPFLYEMTLNSIFAQNYSNFKAIIFNYGDEGNDFIIDYFKLNKIKKDKYVFIKNKDYKGTIENILTASQGHCQKDSISLNIVGNNELIGKNVLKIFNAVYQSNKVGMVYSNFYNYNQGGPIIQGFNIAYPAEDLFNIRNLKFALSSPVTYLTEHILKIKPEDLKDSNGRFLDLAFEQAIFFPIIDIICKKVMKIDGYHLAIKNGINTYELFKESLLLKSEPSMIVRNKKRYNCDQSFNKLISHKSVIHHKQYLIDEPALKSISSSRVQKEGTGKALKQLKNFEITPESGDKLGQYLYKDERVLKTREDFEKQRINFINLQNREDGKKMIKYNLRLGSGVDKQQAKIEQFQNFEAEYRNKISKHQENELPFCLVVQDLSFEFPYQFRFEHVLNSIFNQNYTNFFAIIINQDIHMDQLIRKYLLYNKVNKQRYVYLQNYEERSPIEMLHKALTSHCSYDSYSILLDGSGELLGKNTLKIFNNYFHELGAGVIYSNNYLFTQKEANLHYSSTEKYTDDEKKKNSYRTTNRKFGQLLAFRTELYYNIDVEDFQDEKGNFIDGSMETHLLLSILELSCQKVHKIIGVHYITNEDVKKAKPDLEKSYLMTRKKSYSCSKDKKLTLKASTIDLTSKPELQAISEKHTQKIGSIPAQTAKKFDLLMTNEEGIMIDQYLYKDERLIIKQRKKYQMERESYLQLKSKEDGRQLIQFNLKLDGRTNDKQESLESQDYASIQQIYKNIDIAPEIPMCIIVDRFSFYVPFKFQYTLNSIFSQNYTNYFVVIFGDGSKEGNALLRKYLHFYKIPKERFAYIENKENKGSLENTIFALNNHCSKDSFILNVAGEDQLIGKNVLKTFNLAHQEDKSLLLYSNLYYYSQGISLDYGKPGIYIDEEIKKNVFRSIASKYEYPVFYYSELLRKVDEKDLKFTDKSFYLAAFQKAIVIPMLEQSCGRIRKILGVHYLYNNDRRITVDKSLEEKQMAKLSNASKYTCKKDFELKK